MTPIVFEGCFGWLHPGRGRHGVILCGAFGHESMNAHRGLLELGERLSRLGFHVLRYDYPGTGDSAGSSTDPDRLDRWQASISSASRCLRTISAAERVVVVGLRLGATLALRAGIDMPELEGLVCIAPVASGRSYVRELRLLGNAWREANLLPAPRTRDDRVEVIGECLDPPLLSALGRIDLRNVAVPPVPILLMQDGGIDRPSPLADRLEEQGCAVTRAAAADWSGFLQTSLAQSTPAAAFDELVAWCGGFLPATVAETTGAGGTSEVVGVEPPTLVTADAIERPLLFGPADDLVGILSSPLRRSRHPRPPTVLMLNTGFGRRIGDGRMFVTLARRLAALGVPSLRMDATGFGDSRAPVGRAAHPYDPAHVGDLSEAIDRLVLLGHREFLVIGVCSGAHTAYHAALADSRIRDVILVNLQFFHWKPEASLRIEAPRQRRPIAFYLRAIFRHGGWRRIVRRDVEVGSVLLTLCVRPIHRMLRAACEFAERILGVETRSGAVMRELRRLDADGVGLTFVYSEGDPGITELSRRCGPNGSRLRALPRAHVEMLAAADHALLDRTVREDFIDRVCGRFEGGRDGVETTGPATDHPGRTAPPLEPATAD